MENVPTTELSDSDFTNGEINILDLLVKSSLAPSKSEARRNVQQGGVTVDGEKVTDPSAVIKADDIREKGGVMVRRGKKAYRKVTVS